MKWEPYNLLDKSKLRVDMTEELRHGDRSVSVGPLRGAGDTAGT